MGKEKGNILDEKGDRVTSTLGKEKSENCLKNTFVGENQFEKSVGIRKNSFFSPFEIITSFDTMLEDYEIELMIIEGTRRKRLESVPNKSHDKGKM